MNLLATLLGSATAKNQRLATLLVLIIQSFDFSCQVQNGGLQDFLAPMALLRYVQSQCRLRECATYSAQIGNSAHGISYAVFTRM